MPCHLLSSSWGLLVALQALAMVMNPPIRPSILVFAKNTDDSDPRSIEHVRSETVCSTETRPTGVAVSDARGTLLVLPYSVVSKRRWKQVDAWSPLH